MEWKFVTTFIILELEKIVKGGAFQIKSFDNEKEAKEFFKSLERMTNEERSVVVQESFGDSMNSSTYDFSIENFQYSGESPKTILK